jgi:hypothetical protein
VGLARRLISLYARIGRTYLSRAPGLLVLATVLFVPLGLIDALAVEVDVESLNAHTVLHVAAVLVGAGALTTTSLLGEVLFSGAVAVFLTHPEGEPPPPLGQIARRLRYGRLIAVDLVYVVAVAIGLVALIVPGILIFVWFGLAGPTVEIEDRTVREALARSRDLVRGNFWLVFWVLAPIEVAGDALGSAVDSLVHGVLGHSLFTTWLAESASNIAFTPVFAVAAVLLTLELIAAREGSGPRLHSAPAPA